MNRSIDRTEAVNFSTPYVMWTPKMKWLACRYRYYGWCLLRLRFDRLLEYLVAQWRCYRWRVLLP